MVVIAVGVVIRLAQRHAEVESKSPHELVLIQHQSMVEKHALVFLDMRKAAIRIIAQVFKKN